MRRQQVVVVSGGDTAEHDVSVASGRDVVEALGRRPELQVLDVHVDEGGGWHVGGRDAPSAAFDEVLDTVEEGTVVFPVLHGGWGEGGGLQRELEGRGIPFVGSGAEAAAQALSKRETLRRCARAGVGVVPSRALERGPYVADADLVVRALAGAAGPSTVVKPDTGGSSVGVHIVGPVGLRAALDDVFARDAVALLQPVIGGREVSIGVWEEDGAPRATPASVLHLPRGADGAGFTYAHKYGGAGAVLEIPAALDGALLGALQAAALRCFAALGCRGLARIDFFVDGEGRILLNEINTIPGLRRTSHFSRLVEAAGTSYDDLLGALVRDAGDGSGPDPRQHRCAMETRLA